MNDQKAAGLFGLALRARQAVLGMEACRLMIQSGECGILLLDSEAGPNTRKKAEELCGKAGTPMRIAPAGMIGIASGKANRIAAVRKGSLAEQMMFLLND